MGMAGEWIRILNLTENCCWHLSRNSMGDEENKSLGDLIDHHPRP